MFQVKDFPDWSVIHFADSNRVILRQDLELMSSDQRADLAECFVLSTRRVENRLHLTI